MFSNFCGVCKSTYRHVFSSRCDLWYVVTAVIGEINIMKTIFICRVSMVVVPKFDYFQWVCTINLIMVPCGLKVGSEKEFRCLHYVKTEVELHGGIHNETRIVWSSSSKRLWCFPVRVQWCVEQGRFSFFVRIVGSLPSGGSLLILVFCFLCLLFFLVWVGLCGYIFRSLLFFFISWVIDW